MKLLGNASTPFLRIIQFHFHFVMIVEKIDERIKLTGFTSSKLGWTCYDVKEINLGKANKIYSCFPKENRPAQNGSRIEVILEIS